MLGKSYLYQYANNCGPWAVGRWIVCLSTLNRNKHLKRTRGSSTRKHRYVNQFFPFKLRSFGLVSAKQLGFVMIKEW
jgi:hypothetical protein